MKRRPSRLTQMEPGLPRSNSRAYGISVFTSVRDGSRMLGHHQACPIPSMAAPTFLPMRMASPVLANFGVRLPPARVCSGRLASRISWFWSKPPAASTTALRATIWKGLPRRLDLTVVTRPPSNPRSTSSVFSNNGILRSDIALRKAPISARPNVNRRSLPVFSRHGISSQYFASIFSAVSRHPGSRLERTPDIWKFTA